MQTPFPTISSVVPIFVLTEFTIQKVAHNIYLGGYLAACDKRLLDRERISHVLKMFNAEDDGYIYHDGIKYMVVDASDIPGYDMYSHMDSCVDYIRDSVGAGNILVHCHAGISRSSTMVIAYLMREKGMSFVDAFAAVKKIRPQVQPNAGFIRQLRRYEMDLNGNRRQSMN
jgi:protein-tyrosine phosphatase